jgi:hypothetical protein
MSMTRRRLCLWSTYLLPVVAALHTLYAVYRVTPPLLCFIVLGVTFTASHVLIRREA